jgi:hypothetical protein
LELVCRIDRIDELFTCLTNDTSIGGAEKLVVNVASALLEMGHDIKIYTSHHDKNRCFEETSVTGLLQ